MESKCRSPGHGNVYVLIGELGAVASHRAENVVSGPFKGDFGHPPAIRRRPRNRKRRRPRGVRPHPRVHPPLHLGGSEGDVTCGTSVDHPGQPQAGCTLHGRTALGPVQLFQS